MGVALLGGAPTAAQVKAALVGQDVSANSYTATVGAGTAFSAPNVQDGQFALKIGAGSTGFYMSSSGSVVNLNVSGTNALQISTNTVTVPGVVAYSSFVDGSATPGNATNSVGRGKNAIALGASTCVIANVFVTPNSSIFCSLEANDATATGIKSVVPGVGSFTITVNAAATANLKFSFLVCN